VNRSLTPLSPALYSRRPKPTLSPAGQNPFPHHRVNDDGFQNPGRLPSTSALLTEPATHSPTLPSCAELPACVHFDSLSRFEARPSDERRLFTCADRGATRRSFDFCNQTDPRARPIELFEPCPPLVKSPSRGALTAGGAASRRVSAGCNAWPTELVTGQGPQRLAPRRGSFGGDRSRSEALPQPDRPGHPLSLIRDVASWWCRRCQALASASLRICRRTPRKPRRPY